MKVESMSYPYFSQESTSFYPAAISTVYIFILDTQYSGIIKK